MNKFKRMFALLLLAMGLIVANAAEAVVGDKGPQGPTGKKGPTGDKGLRGDKGATGNTGATGATGRTGAAGPKGGAKGDQGIPGTNGGKGDQGLPGDKGLQGDKGDAGTQIANGTHTGDTLVWNGSAWTPATKTSTGFVLLDANGLVIGDYDFVGSYAILLINSIYYQLPVTHEGFTEQQNIFASTPQSSTYFTTADCTGTAYYEAIDYSSPETAQPFSNRVTLPIVYGNALYKQDPTQVSNILTMSTMIVGYNNNNCMRSGVPDINGGIWRGGMMNVVTPSSMIVIEDLNKYPIPFTIQEN